MKRFKNISPKSNNFLLDGNLLADFIENFEIYSESNNKSDNLFSFRQILLNGSGQIFNSGNSFLRECLRTRREGIRSNFKTNILFRLVSLLEQSNSSYKIFDNEVKNLSAIFYRDSESIASSDLKEIHTVIDNIKLRMSQNTILNNLLHFSEDLSTIDEEKTVRIDKFFHPFFSSFSQNFVIYDKHIFSGNNILGINSETGRISDKVYQDSVKQIYFYLYWVQSVIKNEAPAEEVVEEAPPAESESDFFPKVYIISSPDYRDSSKISDLKPKERSAAREKEREEAYNKSYENIRLFLKSIKEYQFIEKFPGLRNAFNLINDFLDKGNFYILFINDSQIKNLKLGGGGGDSFDHANLIMTDYGFIRWDLRKKYLKINVKESEVTLGKGRDNQDIIKYLIFNKNFDFNSNKWMVPNTIVDDIITISKDKFNMHVYDDNSLKKDLLKKHFS